MYEALFKPIRIGKLEVKNRISMAPMGAFGLVDNEGCYNQRRRIITLSGRKAARD